jgi:hypothetical protein
MLPNHFFRQIEGSSFSLEKGTLKIRATSVCNFQKATQSKRSPNRRKFAQSSGHPASK